jgi:hypothetical protein
LPVLALARSCEHRGMTFHMIFWDALDQNLSLGEAQADFVPAVGDNVTIFTANGATRGQVKSRSWCVDDVGDAPPAHKPYSVNLIVKVQP